MWQVHEMASALFSEFLRNKLFCETTLVGAKGLKYLDCFMMSILIDLPLIPMFSPGNFKYMQVDFHVILK